MASKKTKTKFGQGFKIKISTNDDSETSSRKLIVDGDEKGELAFNNLDDVTRGPGAKKTEGGGHFPTMKRTEYYKKLEELAKNIFLKPDEPCDLEVLRTNEFPIVRLRNKETHQDLTKFLGKVVEQKNLPWPPFIGYRICTKINKKMVRCIVKERLQNQDQILVELIDDGKILTLNRESSLLYTLPKDLVKLPSLVFKVKIEFDEDLAEKPEIFDQIVNTRIIGIPQKDTVKLKVQGTPYLGKIIEDEQVQYIRQYFQKARVSRIAPRIPNREFKSSSQENSNVVPNQTSPTVEKNESIEDKKVENSDNTSNFQEHSSMVKNSKASIPSSKIKEKSATVFNESDRATVVRKLADILKAQRLADSAKENPDENSAKSTSNSKFEPLSEELKSKLANVKHDANGLEDNGVFVPIEIDETSNPFNLRVKIKNNGDTFSVILHNLKLIKQSSGEHDVLMQILCRKNQKLYATRKSPLYDENTKNPIIIELISADCDLTKEILEKCSWVKPFKVMEDDIIKEPLDKKMVFEFAGLGSQTNEIFAVRASHRNLLEKEYLNLLPYLELETDIQDNLIVIVQCSFDEENLFRAKIFDYTGKDLKITGLDYANSEVELYKSGENWCLDPDDTDITFNLFKHPVYFDTIPATLYTLKIHGITAKPCENEEIFDEFFKIDNEGDNLKKFKIGEIIGADDNEVTLRTQQANNFEKMLLVKIDGYLALYQDLIIGQKYSGMISYLDDDVVWIVLGTDQDRLNLLLQTCQEGFKLVQSSKNLKKSYEPKIGEICYFKDNEESQLVRVIVLEISNSELILKQIDFGDELDIDKKESFFLPCTSHLKAEKFYQHEKELESVLKKIDFTTFMPGAFPCVTSGDEAMVKATEMFENGDEINFSVVTKDKNEMKSAFQMIKIK